MKQYTAPAIFIGLTIIFAILLAPYTTEPEIYAIDNIEESGVFKNPIALKQISQEKTADLQPLMQDFFDASGTIVLNVRLKNFEDAEEDLAEYRRAAKQFDHMVINLDMSESEIGEFKKNNADNLRNLEELINDSVSFDELSQLEIQYRDANDPAKMYAIAYEGEALREKLSQEFAQYQNHTTAMAQAGRNLETDPEKMESSVPIYSEYISEITGVQEERIVQAKEVARQNNEQPGRIIQEDLTLAIDPPGGIYADVLNVIGIFSRTGDIPKGEPVALYIDSRKHSSSSCTSAGEYFIPIAIRKMYAGIHLAYTRAGDVFSPIMPFTVTETPGILTLNVSVRSHTIFSTGNLRTEDIGVAGAPVTIYITGAENKTETITYTDDAGRYTCETEMGGGTYTIRSVFSDPAFPVTECTSREVEISIGESNLYLYLFLLIAGTAGGGYVLLRRRRTRTDTTTSPSDHDEYMMTEVPLSPPSPHDREKTEKQAETESTETIMPSVAEFHNRYEVACAELSPSDAARILGDGFTFAVSRHTTRTCRPSDTMREQAAMLDENCSREAFAFVLLYEAMVYGREQTAGDALLRTWDEAMQCMGAT